MLNGTSRIMSGRIGRHSVAYQGGVVLVLALVILVVMTIAGIALVRSVDTGSVVAGNLAFQQAATQAGGAGVEDAIVSFLNDKTTEQLQVNDYANAYAAAVTNPTDWDAYWTATINPNPVTTRPVATKTCVDRSCTLPTDAAGNTVTYTIQRLCQTTGDPMLDPTGCVTSKTVLSGGEGNSLGAGSARLNKATQYYYRVTSRVEGPRNTLTYTQTIVAR